ncbi:MAG: hypothetical protein AAFN18_13235 [Cyanobacteria bacterium J06554_6]
MLESKKTTISARAARPQALAYMMANPDPTKQPLFGCLTNGNEIVFIKLAQQSGWCYALSRAFSLYTDPSEMVSAVRSLKR